MAEKRNRQYHEHTVVGMAPVSGPPAPASSLFCVRHELKSVAHTLATSTPAEGEGSGGREAARARGSMPGDPHRAREAASRSGSPPKPRGGEQERRVLGLRPFGPANISGFPGVTPSAGEQANPRQHGRRKM